MLSTNVGLGRRPCMKVQGNYQVQCVVVYIYIYSIAWPDVGVDKYVLSVKCSLSVTTREKFRIVMSKGCDWPEVAVMVF